jgi:hypothetical protein
MFSFFRTSCEFFLPFKKKFMINPAIVFFVLFETALTVRKKQCGSDIEDLFCLHIGPSFLLGVFIHWKS